jgi:histidyl-tRNA synthetase
MPRNIAKKQNTPKKQKQTKNKFSVPKGMKDTLPEEQKYWEYFLGIAKPLVEADGFLRLDTPILEQEALFKRGTGAVTDVVEKEMFTLRTKGGDRLALRPEFTPNIIRAYLEHGMFNRPQPVKLYYCGPVFRYSKPQADRLRQFHQLGFEAIGNIDPILDAQVIYLGWKILEKLGLKNLSIQINSIGCSVCRPEYLALLTEYYRNKKRNLCAICKVRLNRNPLRLLDCKEKQCLQLMVEAPQSVDYLCPSCHDHFKNVLEYLDELDLPYELNHRLVRGLDYYTKTVFEFWPEGEEELAQNALGGGGRYDGLVELLGGPETPAVGLSLGVERIINRIKKIKRIKLPDRVKPQVFLAQLGALSKRKSLGIISLLRENKIRVAEALTRNTLKSQLRIADRLNIDICLILGQKEALENSIIIRDMHTGVQEVIPQEKLIGELKRRLKQIRK